MTEAMKQKQAAWYKISREQRAAYFAWQAAPAGDGDAALNAYIEATKRQRDFR